MSIITSRFARSFRIALIAVLALVTTCCLLGRTAEAAIESRDVLKTYFETGDVPTEAQFSNFIDSFIHQVDDGFTYNGASPDAAAQGALIGEGTEVGPGLFFTPVAGLGEDWAGQSGFLALSLELDAQTHYGYLQISSPPGDSYPMFVEHFAFETEPNVPIIATHIPEPSALALLAGGLALMGLKRRRRVC